MVGMMEVEMVGIMVVMMVAEGMVEEETRGSAHGF